MTDANQVRINELARELEVKAKAIIDLLPGYGVTEKKTHSSSIPADVAEKVREKIQGAAEAEARVEAAAKAEKEAKDAAVKAARRTFDAGRWPNTGPGKRARTLLKAAALIRQRSEELAQLEAHLERALRERLGPKLAFSATGQAPVGDGPLAVCTSSAFFDPPQAERARALLAGGGILCALRSPYDATLFPGVPALLGEQFRGVALVHTQSLARVPRPHPRKLCSVPDLHHDVLCAMARA